MVDFKVQVYDGSYHEVDSSEMAFKIAGSMAFKEAMKKADPVLMEPIMKVSVIVPEDYMGDVIGDLNSRRGQIQGMEARSGAPAAETCSAWRRSTARKRSVPKFPFRKCSATRPTFVPARRAEASIQWSLATTRKCPRASRKKSFPANK